MALAVDPGVLTTMPKPGILLRQGLLSGGPALADTRSCPLPDHLCRGCRLTRTQSKSILFLLVHVQLDASNSKTAWEASVTVVSAARVVSDHLSTAFSPGHFQIQQRDIKQSGSSIKKGAKNLFSFSAAISWSPPSLRELSLSALCLPPASHILHWSYLLRYLPV